MTERTTILQEVGQAFRENGLTAAITALVGGSLAIAATVTRKAFTNEAMLERHLPCVVCMATAALVGTPCPRTPPGSRRLYSRLPSPSPFYHYSQQIPIAASSFCRTSFSRWWSRSNWFART